MLQRVTIVKLGGAAGRMVGDIFGRWRSKQLPGDREWEESWPESCQSEMDELVATSVRHGCDLPTLYCCQYTESWNMSDLVQEHFGESPGMVQVSSGRHTMTFIPVTSEEKELLARINRKLRKRNLFQEARWFLVNLKEAINAWSQLLCDVDGAILVFQEKLACSWTDEEVLEGVKAIPDWLRSINGECSPQT